MAQNAGGNVVDTTGKVPEGIVLPPKDIRAIIEKTAGYVARNGVVFEDRIRDKEQSNPKFSFLAPNDAYGSFYQWRLSEVRAGRNADLSGSRAAPPESSKPKGPEEPPEFLFSARQPNVSALDLEVLRLTALHVARKGKSWMTSLSQREARNFQFDFLRPQHSLYNFFQRMVDQYTILLQTGPEGQKAEQARISVLQANIQDRFKALEAAKKRAEYIKYTETQKQKKEEEEEAERIAYAQVDWHDFVVVETVLFTEIDDQTDLPPPTTLNDLQSASLEQKAMMSLARPDMRIEEAMPTDDYGNYADYQDVYELSQNGYTQPQSIAMSYTTTPPVPQSTYSPVPAMAIPGQNPAAASVPAPASSQSAPLRIRQDYVPRAQQRTQASAASSICPNCGQRILNSELDEHLRIELLDPQWKEQQSKAAERFSTITTANMDIAANLKRLRPPTAAPPAATGMGDEEERRKRAKLNGSADAVSYQESWVPGKG